MADSFRKCIRDKSATLLQYPQCMDFTKCPEPEHRQLVGARRCFSGEISTKVPGPQKGCGNTIYPWDSLRNAGGCRKLNPGKLKIGHLHTGYRVVSIQKR